MKDSGIEWIGEIPEDWGIIKAKYILVANDGGVWGDDPTGSDNDKIVLRSTEQTVDGLWCINEPARRDLSKISYVKSLIFPNDLLMTKSSGSCAHIGKTTLAGTYFSTHECYYSNFLQRLRVKKSFSPKYIWYTLNSIFTREQFVFLQNSTSGIGNINSENINNIILPLLSLSEQQRITDYLDKKCAAVDRLMENQRMQIEKLKEYKQSVITEAVTKGIDKTASIKNSGNIYYPQIPSGWGIQKILSILSMPITDGPHTTPQLFEDGIAFVSAEAVSCGNGHIDFSHIRGYISVEFYNECCKKYVPQLDDIYMIKSGATTGKVCIVDTLNPTFTIWSPLAVLRSNKEKCYPKFLFYGLQSTNFQKQVAFNWSYGTQQNLGMRTLEQLLLPIPPLSEQQQIAEYLDKKCAEIDKLISIKQQKIEKLTEYKKSLIYEYVTGKKQVG